MVNGVIVNSAVHNYPLNTGTTYPVSPRNPGGRESDRHVLRELGDRLRDLTDGTSQTVCISETIQADAGGSTTWDGVSQTQRLRADGGNDNATNGPELTDYASQCHGSGLQLQQTRGSRWLYGAPGHSMYNHIRPPNDPDIDCRGGLPHSNRTNLGGTASRTTSPPAAGIPAACTRSSATATFSSSATVSKSPPGRPWGAVTGARS